MAEISLAVRLLKNQFYASDEQHREQDAVMDFLATFDEIMEVPMGN